MSDADQHVSDATRAAESEDERQNSGADRPPTAEEEAVADAQPPLDPEVADAYAHQAEVGANIEGEGKVG